MNARIKPSGLTPRESVGAPTPQFSDDVVRRARLIQHRGGYSAREVREHLLDEGHDVPITTVEAWLDGTSRRFAGFPTE